MGNDPTYREKVLEKKKEKTTKNTLFTTYGLEQSKEQKNIT